MALQPGGEKRSLVGWQVAEAEPRVAVKRILVNWLVVAPCGRTLGGIEPPKSVVIQERGDPTQMESMAQGQPPESRVFLGLVYTA